MAAAQLSTTETLTHLGDFLASGGHQTIGALVFWSLSGVKCRRDELRAALKEAGVGAAMGKDPGHAASLSRAVHAVKAGKPQLVERRLAKGWALVIQSNEVGEGGKLKLVHAATVQADPLESAVRRRQQQNPHQIAHDLEWKFQAPAAELRAVLPIAREVEEKYLEVRDWLDTAGLSEILVNAMHGTSKDQLLGAVSLRQSSGGLYFVHGSKLPLLHALRGVVERFAPACDINVMTITGSQDNLAAAGKAARQGFQHQLQELRAELAEFRASTELGKRRETSITVRAEGFRRLQARVELFRDVLGGVADELGAQIEEARGEVERLLEIA
jgi:hypothetical protein